MMKVCSLAIQGFRSFKTDSTLAFANGPGFFFLRGENRVNPRLGGNACGKSSIWDALCWVFFGKTARGLKAGDVANWDDNDLTSVQVIFKRFRHEYTLIRTHNPNTLSLTKDAEEPRTVSQNEVEALIGLDHDGFLYQVLMGQFGRFFFDIGPTEKLNLFSKALNLDYWLEKSAEAKKYAEEAAGRLGRMEREHAELAGRLSVLKETKAELKRSYREWNDNQARKIRDLRRESRDSAKVLEEAKAEHREARSRKLRLREKREDLQRKLIKWDDKRAKARDVVKDLERDLKGSEQDLSRAKDRLAEVKKLGGGECPTCEQKVKDRHVCNVRERYRLLFQVNDAEIEMILSRLDEARGTLEKAERVLKKINSRLNKVENAAEAAGRAESSAKSLLARAEDHQVITAKGLEMAKNETNPDKARYREVREQYREAVVSHFKKGKKIEIARDKVAKGEFWAKAFKRLRLHVIEEALIELEVATNNSLEELGLEGWTVKYDVEKENKSGGLTKGFTVLIQSPESEKPVKWENWSGGETQRLRVAGAAALADLTANRRGVSWNLEVWDEPTAYMSDEGIQDLLSFFEARSRRDKKQLWLVDHRSLNFGGFSGHVKVVREPSGSKIEA